MADTTIQAAMDWLVWIAGDKPEVRTIRDRIAALEAEVARLQSTSERLTVLCCEQVTRAETAEAALAEARRDAERWRGLRDMTPCILSLTRNDEHAVNYTTAAEWIAQFPDDFADDPPEEVERMKSANVIWTLHVYPNSPVGFVRWHGATLGSVIDAALHQHKENGA